MAENLVVVSKVKKMVKDELLAVAEEFGDKRRTRIVERGAAQAIDETELVVAEPVTVVLSARGWARAAKGHDIDPRALGYKTGDEFRAAARGKSTQLAVFLDSTGRAYSVPAHTLPSARGQGEPLSGRIDPPDGASFASVLAGVDEFRLTSFQPGFFYGFTVFNVRVDNLFVTTTPAAVPAPGALLLFASGLVALWRRRR